MGSLGWEPLSCRVHHCTMTFIMMSQRHRDMIVPPAEPSSGPVCSYGLAHQGASYWHLHFLFLVPLMLG